MEEAKMKLTLKTLKAVNNVFGRLCKLGRWTDFVSENKYNELAKQSLNCIVTYMLATHIETAGVKVRWEMFPKIAIYRSFQKAYVYFDILEDTIDEICSLEGIKQNAFEKVTREIIAKETDLQFASFICEGRNIFENQIYRAATKIATYIELMENQSKMNGEYIFKLQQIVASLEKYKRIPGVTEFTNVESPTFKVLQNLSRLRNQNRWAGHFCSVECSVLGHLFDTAILAYFMSLENNSEDEEMATRMFFMGIYHDVAENWTKDIPSPIKDRVPGFRKATERFELKMIDVHVYQKVKESIAHALKKVMLEDEKNKEFKRLIKGADYLAADSECWRQYKAGTRDEYFKKATLERKERLDSGIEFITPTCRQLYDYFVEYEQGLNI
jgi:5'-deoxynucleotidase YfbR-like HD superfamily hydrolase